MFAHAQHKPEKPDHALPPSRRPAGEDTESASPFTRAGFRRRRSD